MSKILFENVSINPQILNLKESATLKVNQQVKSQRARGEKVYHFGFGQSPFPVHRKIVQTLQENANKKDYLPTLGLLELRKQIAEYYRQNFNYNFNPEHMLIGPGSKELIFQCLYALEGPVIIPAPSWVSYGPQVNIRGKKFISPMTSRENNYKLTSKDLEFVCETMPVDQQKILIINSPNNPTGQVYTDQEIEGLTRVCRDNNIIVISDEIYGMIDFTNIKKKGFSFYYPEGTIVTAGLSKSHSAGGYRLGFLAAPKNMEKLVKALSALVSETFSAVSAPIQYAAVTAYSMDPEIEESLRICNKIHEYIGHYIYYRLQKMQIECPAPEGAFYIFPDFINYKKELHKKYDIQTSLQLAEVLLTEAQIALLPGSDFYLPSSSLTARMSTVDYEGDSLYQSALDCRGEMSIDFVQKNAPRIVEGLNSLESFLSGCGV
ncbi:MAG: aminotransferase class I/II-fold pyridoxal phosphate-dependent enzyme [Bdellovibrionaceae bacterium]|nr:aminotransferase class I/II-fold pyridoxal phosphate-dependent enzyme [Pseudobdellovibrionaceae bacterium]